MQETFLQMIQQYGYIGIALLIFAETVFPPIPSEAVLLFAGFLTVKAGLQVWWVVFWATAGAVLGAVLLYLAGRGLGLARIERLVSGRWGRWLHFRPEQLHRANEWFTRRAYASVFICRCLPVLRSIISVPAGISKMPFWPFLGLTAAGSYLWNTGLVWLGRLAGDAWQSRLQDVNRWITVVAIVLGALTAVWLLWQLLGRKKAGRNIRA